MEKEYIKPQVQIIELEMEQSVLTASNPTIGINDTDTTDEWD